MELHWCQPNMTLNDAMRSKARLSITGSTGENGRVMTPEFPKAVHAVPYVDNDELERRSLRAMKKDFRALGWLVKGLGAQIVFYSVPPVLGTDELINKKIRQINAWIHNWCYQQGFGFSDHSLIYRTLDLLANDGKTLSRKGKRVVGQELARLMDRALN
ncbi:hypothetical protein llap_2276 [Limosa lapponica baueri]|uniref:Uncharacterized protein n=1 Tax=Limosa lapponica baueri TaxID=1758121 RepID=A0A2I0UN45_LIMLA|nr:hypothetical protein llap_2276 [Limosa lapponica baueri]